MRTINKLKKIAIGIRSIIKVSVIIVISALLILGILQISYKQTYSVSLNGEIIGYTNDKVALQKRINDYITSGNGQDVAFVEVENLPTYTACLLKKNVETNDNEIFDKVTESGTSYYKYYAITVDNNEKAYVSSFDEAQNVVDSLKEKDSANSDSLGIVEKYNTAKAEFTPTETCIDQIYEKKVVKTTTTISSYKKIATTVDSSQTSVATDIGITLIRPVSGTISSRFGVRSRDNHKGLDIAAPAGTAIKAAASGTVIVSGYNSSYSGYGNCLVIQSTSAVTIIYGHCSQVYAKTGESIVQGQVIAAVGSTGNSTGNHLHFEIRYNGTAIDPQNYVYNE